MARLNTVKIHSKKLKKTMTVNAQDWNNEALRSRWEQKGYEVVSESYRGTASEEEENVAAASSESKAKAGGTSKTADTTKKSGKKTN